VNELIGCKIKGCQGEFLARGLCRKHYLQLWRYGKILKRTRFDKNKIILHKDYAEMLLYDQEKRHIIARTKIDLGDVEKIKEKKWFLHSGYCFTNHHHYLHSFLLGVIPNTDIDHINKDKLDNRRSNFRRVTHQQNMTNQKVRKNSPLGITGVSLVRGKYCATIMSNYKAIHLGLYATLNEAIRARKQGEKTFWGEI
jgi:hypothetical protein